MATSRTDRIQDELRTLRAASPDVIGSAVVSIEGFVISSILPGEIDEDLVSGMAAAMLGVGERISSELMGAALEQTFVRSEKGYVILNAVGSEAVLAVLTTKEARLGLIFIDIRRRVAELRKLI
ncbi:MAG: roadblock/LC7 domain-containing protein [Polyangiaceae bacterium]|nr:roadblock/LC7 domain-containing protein [Polyangiaceae bacterium]